MLKVFGNPATANMIPLFGVLWGFLFLDEKIGANTLAACALIVCGTWLALRNVRPGVRRTVAT